MNFIKRSLKTIGYIYKLSAVFYVSFLLFFGLDPFSVYVLYLAVVSGLMSEIIISLLGGKTDVTARK